MKEDIVLDPDVSVIAKKKRDSRAQYKPMGCFADNVACEDTNRYGRTKAFN